MVSTHHFAQGDKRKACDNFLDCIWGTIRFFEKIEWNLQCRVNGRQKRTYPLFSAEGFKSSQCLKSGLRLRILRWMDMPSNFNNPSSERGVHNCWFHFPEISCCAWPAPLILVFEFYFYYYTDKGRSHLIRHPSKTPFKAPFKNRFFGIRYPFLRASRLQL